LSFLSITLENGVRKYLPTAAASGSRILLFCSLSLPYSFSLPFSPFISSSLSLYLYLSNSFPTLISKRLPLEAEEEEE